MAVQFLFQNHKCWIMTRIVVMMQSVENVTWWIIVLAPVIQEAYGCMKVCTKNRNMENNANFMLMPYFVSLVFNVFQTCYYD